ncbi:uncharacterized protein CEXT_416001 [Caerostris extrusa]|uniref:Uncharacterized protein n=1 Tax=Caerostris extrusa TaxID=172846 RepID=A0AAV4SBE2_CAEEX|nr:uncharacterized protein CEXT_416001 [Caerostris extrusa]
MVRRAENIKEQLKPIKDSFKDIKITLSGELFKIFAKDSDEHRNVTKFLQNNKMDFYLITPRNERPIKAVIEGLPRNTPAEEIEQELSDLNFKNSKVTQLTNLKTKTPIAVWQIVLPHFVLLQETILKPTQTIFIPNYNFFRNDGPQNPVSGGTAILIKNNISHHEVPIPSLKSIKQLL